MDFTLSKKHEMARQLFKEFAENEVKPLAQEVDEKKPLQKCKNWVSWEFLCQKNMADRVVIL